MSEALLRSWPLPSHHYTDKVERGTVLLIAGSSRTPGAALLAGVAALRVGAGRLQIATMGAAADELAVAVPEALVERIESTREGQINRSVTEDQLSAFVSEAQAVLIGPGLDDLSAAGSLLEIVISHISSGAVVVADALAMIALPTLSRTGIESLQGRIVLTPNRREAEELFSRVGPAPSGWEITSALAEAFGAVVTSEGEVRAADRRGWHTHDRVAGIGTSGSGDVLAGLITGAAARCADPAQAACWGTYLHLAAGRRVGDLVGPLGFLAREMLDPIPRIIEELTADP